MGKAKPFSIAKKEVWQAYKRVKTVLYQVFKYLDVVLSRWAKRKYKRIKGRQRRAIHWVKRIIFRQPGLFAHWRFIYAWARR